MIQEKDAEVLRWCGALGHTFVLVIDDGTGGRRCALESCDRKSSVRHAREEYRGARPALYNQVAVGKWKPVRLPKAVPS